jgi:hypothetical protein
MVMVPIRLEVLARRRSQSNLVGGEPIWCFSGAFGGWYECLERVREVESVTKLMESSELSKMKRLSHQASATSLSR